MTTIADTDWVDVNADQDGLAPRLLASVTLFFGAMIGPNARPVRLHLTAICVADPDVADLHARPYIQEAMNAEDEGDLNLLYQLSGASKPLEMVRIGGAGDDRPYVVYAEPYES